MSRPRRNSSAAYALSMFIGKRPAFNWKRTAFFLAGALTVSAVSTMGTQANQAWAAALKPGIPTNTTPVTIGEPTAFSGAFLPYLSSSASTNFVVEQQFGSLLHLRQNLAVAPELVAKWWYESNGQRLYMQLSKNAVWSDGTPITSADIGLAVNFLASPVYNNQLLGTQGYRVLPIVGSRAVMAGQAQTVAGFHAVNGSEFYFQLRAPDPSALVRDFAGMMPLPSAVLGSIPYASWPTSQFAADPDVGSGPFLISSSGGAQVDLTANRKFVLGIPKLQNFIVRVATSAVLPGLLHAGEIDLYSGVSPSLAAEASHIAGYRVMSTAGNGYTFLGWKDNLPGYGSVAFRRAVEYAINRKALISSVFGGQATLENGPLPPDSMWYNTALNNAYPYQPQTARNLLMSAGFHIGPKLWIVQPGGQPLGATIAYAQGDPYGKQEATAIVNDLRAIAVDASVGPALSPRQMIYDLQSNPPAIQGYVMGWQFGVDPNPADLWSANAMYNIDTVNWTNTADAAVAANNSLIAEQESAAATNTATRQQILNKWQALVSQNAPENFLVDPNLLGVQSTRLQGVVWSGAQGPIDSWKWTVS
ncbi:MAG: ABC transporter substrate-binding protein [Bacilli bacterium]